MHMHMRAHTHTHTHRGLPLNDKKKNEILPSATIWMDLEGVTLVKISQRKTNTA